MSTHDYRTWLPLTLIFDTEAEDQEQADAQILTLSFDIAAYLHQLLDDRGLVEVRVHKSEIEARNGGE